MDTFTEICEQYEPMITRVLQKAQIYKELDHYRQVARIGLWKAVQNYNPAKGDFAPYAYWTMLTSLYTEMNKDNRYRERHVPFEKDDLTNIAHYNQVEDETVEKFEELEELLAQLSEVEYRLIKSLYLHGQSYEEIAVIEGRTVASIKKRRQRTMEKLRKMVQEN